MMNKRMKFAIILAIMIIVLGMVENIVMAAGWDQTISTTTINDNGKIKSGMNNIIGIIQAVAIGVAVVYLILLGIKFMQASPDGKADIKKHLIIYVAGAVLLFATTGVLQIIKGFTEEIVPTTSSITKIKIADDTKY